LHTPASAALFFARTFLAHARRRALRATRGTYINCARARHKRGGATRSAARLALALPRALARRNRAAAPRAVCLVPRTLLQARRRSSRMRLLTACIFRLCAATRAPRGAHIFLHARCCLSSYIYAPIFWFAARRCAGTATPHRAAHLAALFSY